MGDGDGRMKKKIFFLLAALFILGQRPLEGKAAELTGPAEIEMEDGEYAIDVSLEGGSGRSTIASPAILIVQDGRAYARIEWSSSHYDYMMVAGEKYLPVNEEGNSVFEIPVLAFDEPVTVTGDTTAMSVPHEIDYQLIFFSEGITVKNPAHQGAAIWLAGMAVLIAAVCVIVLLTSKRRGNSVK